MYDLRLDRKLTQALFSKWDKDTKDWVVNAIASLVVVDNVVEADTDVETILVAHGAETVVKMGHLVVEDNFMPEVGFLRRDNFRRSYTSGRYSPRPQSIDAIRQFRLEAALDYTVAADTGTVETRQTQLGFLTEFETSDRVGVSVAENYEYLDRPFELNPSVTLPIGGYRFRDVEAKYTPGAQRRLTGTFTARVGEYFNGSIRSFGLQRAP